MLHRNTNLAKRIVRSLKGLPKDQRSSAVGALQSYYDNKAPSDGVKIKRAPKLHRAGHAIAHSKVKLYNFDPEVMEILGQEAQRQK